jgi:hypothetical protein
MSRYINVTLQLHSLDEIAAALTSLQLAFERPRDRTMLEGSLECPGEPVDIRLAAGTLGTVEDFGFVVTGQEVRLVCGELDADPLKAALVRPLHAAIVEARLQAAGMITRKEVRADGVTRIVVDDDI